MNQPPYRVGYAERAQAFFHFFEEALPFARKARAGCGFHQAPPDRPVQLECEFGLTDAQVWEWTRPCDSRGEPLFPALPLGSP